MSRTRTTTLAAVITLCIAGLASSGCATSPSAGATAFAHPSKAPSPRDAWRHLQTGMTRGEVRMLLGEPSGTRPSRTSTAEADVWVYRHEERVVRQKATDLEAIPFVDPISGVMGSIQEPVYSQETTTLVHVLFVHWNGDALESWRTDASQSRFYAR